MPRALRRSPRRAACSPPTAATSTRSATRARFFATVPAGVVARLTSRRRSIALALRYDAAKAQRLADLAAAGAIRPHVERTIALEEVAEAQRAMETGHGRGKIVVRTA